MAGKKKKDAKNEAQAGPALPKKVGGAKLPKNIREKLGELAKHPVVADLLAAGLVALAARIKNEPKVQAGAAKAGGKARGAAKDVAEAAAEVAAAVALPVLRRTRKSAPDKTAGGSGDTPPATGKAPAAAAAPTPSKPRAPRKKAAAPAAKAPARRRAKAETKAEGTAAAPKPRTPRRPASRPAPAPADADPEA